LSSYVASPSCHLCDILSNPLGYFLKALLVFNVAVSIKPLFTFMAEENVATETSFTKEEKKTFYFSL
jgi:hypothetical protein